MLNLCENPSHLGHEAICLVCQIQTETLRNFR
jgi:hypothetical protein